MFACIERRARRPGKMIPHGFFILALEGLLQIVPGAGAREERLRDMEAEIVVVRVEEPGGHILKDSE